MARSAISTELDAIDPVRACTIRALFIWDQIEDEPFSDRARRILRGLRAEHFDDYCTVLGMIYGLAVYRNSELPEGARGDDPNEFCMTVPTNDIHFFPGELEVGVDPIALWVNAARTWCLEDRYANNFSLAVGRLN